MNAKIYVIDDDPSVLDMITDYIAMTSGIELIGATTDSLHGLNMITRYVVIPDIVFLDIEMPGMSGDAMAPLLMSLSEVVFVTGRHDYAVQAYNLNMADYLHKPFDYARFLQAINKVLAKLSLRERLPLSNAGKSIILKVGGSLVKVPEEDIVMIESERHKVKVYTAKEIYITYLSIAEMAEALGTAGFMRINKSYIVNLKKIQRVEGNDVFLENGYRAVVGPTYRSDFLKKMKDMRG